jgi:glycerol-3-phosphate acyltransferase PlsX
MQGRTLADLTTQKQQNILANAPIAASLVYLIVCALIVATMIQSLSMEKKNKILPSIGIDLTGSDEDSNLVAASLLPILESLKHVARFILFGEEKNKEQLDTIPFISYKIASEAISMEEKALTAIRERKGSSIHLGIQALENKEIDAFISMGNTGALMLAAKLQLGTLPSITRPALMTLLPTKKQQLAILDVGANTTCRSDHLVEFAAMGIAYQKARGIKHPKVGLLNIGTESSRGTTELQEAYQKLSALSSEYEWPFFSGNVEARDAFQGSIDVLVTGGFAGNIFLKTCEGIGELLLDKLSKDLTSQELQRQLDYGQYPGALLCGVNGLVIKCHGSARSASFSHSLSSAVTLLEEHFLLRIKEEVGKFFSKK